MPNLTQDLSEKDKEKLTNISYEVANLICKELGITLYDYTQNKLGPSFIAAGIKDIIMNSKT